MPDAEKGAANVDPAKANADGKTTEEKKVEAGAAGDDETAAELVRRETHDRVLKESQKFKTRALSAEDELTALKKSQLEKQQEYKTLWEQSETKLKELQKREVALRLTTSVGELASKAGCVSVTDLMAVGDTDLLNYDTETGQVHGADLFVEKARKDKPWLFSNGKSTSVNGALPGGTKVAGGKEDLSKLSKDEIMSRLRALPRM
jgi:hypothetical protein